MNLSKKKKLAMRTLGVGKDRIAFVESRLSDIKEAITKQDIRDLIKDGAIIIKEVGGRKADRKRSNRGPGNIRKITRVAKKDYITITRKLRKHMAEMKKSGEMSKDAFKDIRKKIRNKVFRSKSHLREYLGEMKK